MIKCNVTVIGTICRSGEARTDKDGKPFFTFGIRTNIPANQGDEKPVDISVAMNGTPENQGDFREGAKVKVQGVLSFRKKDDNLYLNLSASDVTFGPEDSDSIKGTMSFKGTTGSKDIPEKKGKKGAYRLFDAFSSEKTADAQYVYTWVHFVDFSSDRPDWLGPKKGIEAEGDLELSYFNERLSLNCIVSSLSFWEKPSSNQ